VAGIPIQPRGIFVYTPILETANGQPV
jgi:hypothetical protein